MGKIAVKKKYAGRIHNGFDGYAKNNLLNRTFRRDQILEKQVMDENKSLYNIGKLRNFKVINARGKYQEHLNQTGRGLEYFPKGDTGFPFLDDESNMLPLSGRNKYRTLINGNNISSGELKSAVGLDFVSHGLHDDKKYMDYHKQLNDKLLTKYSQEFIDNNGGTDAYVRGLLSDSKEYDPYKKETAFIGPEFINSFKNYIKTGK